MVYAEYKIKLLMSSLQSEQKLCTNECTLSNWNVWIAIRLTAFTAARSKSILSMARIILLQRTPHVTLPTCMNGKEVQA